MVLRILSVLFALAAIALLSFYLFSPSSAPVFLNYGSKNTNFTLNSMENSSLQFYPNMRYPDKKISYKISGCPLQRQNDMENAFELLSQKTVLNFYPVESEEEISVACSEDTLYEGNIFVAGEGGPINITTTENFNVILHGKILLLRESDCPSPNIATHELLHALGFEHSENKNNLMYNFTNCNQELGEDIPAKINEIYSTASLPDLTFEETSAEIDGRYIGAEVNIRNNGLKKSEEAELEVYADNSLVGSFNINQIGIGYGIQITFSNYKSSKTNPVEIKFVINSTLNELDKENNVLILKK